MIWWGGVCSEDVGVVVERFPDQPGPARRLETVQIPGRNGDLIIDSGAYDNYTQEYEVYFHAGINRTPQAARRVRAWLAASASYQRLEDSYDPEYFRMAYYAGPSDIENIMNEFGRMTISFACKPQRWRKDGETITTFDGKAPAEEYTGGAIYNFEQFASLPYMKVYGTRSSEGGIIGEILVRHFDENGAMDKSNSLTIKSITGYVEIDSDTQNAYRGTLNANDTVSIAEFPQLLPGKNQILYNRDIEKIEIKPRWWTI